METPNTASPDQPVPHPRPDRATRSSAPSADSTPGHGSSAKQARSVSENDRPQHRRTIKVDTLARVEGEGSLYIKIEGDRVADVKLKIFEPPRMFEAFLRGRHFSEAPDITARICGICPIAYQMSAVHAIERALGIRIDPAVRLLRRLFYCGEWIESHALHVYMLHAPDFLGLPRRDRHGARSSRSGRAALCA